MDEVFCDHCGEHVSRRDKNIATTTGIRLSNGKRSMVTECGDFELLAPPYIRPGRVDPTWIEICWDVRRDMRSDEERDTEADNIRQHVQRQEKDGWITIYSDFGDKYVDEGLDPSTSYSYRIRQQIDGRLTEWSNPVQISFEQRAMTVLHEATDSSDLSKILSVLQKPPFKAKTYQKYTDYYKQRLQLAQENRGTLSVREVCELIDEENETQAIQAVNGATDTNDIAQVWTSLNLPSLGLIKLRPKYQDDGGYMKTLCADKSEKHVDLSKKDIQASVLRANKEGAISVINTTINDHEGTAEIFLEALMDPDSELRGTVCGDNAKEYFMIFREEKEERKRTKQREVTFKQDDIEGIVTDVNENVSLLRLNTCLEEATPKRDNVMRILSVTSGLNDLKEDNLLEYTTLLKAHKDYKESRQRLSVGPDRQHMTKRKGRLSIQEIQETITIANNEKTYIVINDRRDEENVWLKALAQGYPQSNTSDVKYKRGYKKELNRRTQKKTQNKENDSDRYDLYTTRLTREEIEKIVKDVNEHRAVANVMRSSRTEANLLWETLSSPCLDIPQNLLNQDHSEAYFHLMKQSMEKGEKKDIYQKVADDDDDIKDEVTKKEVTDCLDEIKRIVRLQSAVADINSAIEKSPKQTWKALRNPDAELQILEEKEKEGQMNGYHTLLLDDKKEKGSASLTKEDIGKDLMNHDILKTIDIILMKPEWKDGSLYEELRKESMSLTDDLIKNDELCYRTLFLAAKQKKKKEKEQISSRNPYKERLTKNEIKRMVQEHAAVKQIHDQLTKSTWHVALREKILGLQHVKDDCVEGYRKLFTDEWKAKKECAENKKERSSGDHLQGYDKYLDRDEIQGVIEMHAGVIKINKVLERYIRRENVDESSISKQGKTKRQKEQQRQKAEHDRLSDLEKEALEALRQKDVKLVEGIIIHQQKKVYLKLLSERRKVKKDITGDIEDMSFAERLTKKEIEEVISEWKGFEKFAQKLVSPDISDQQCASDLEKLLNTEDEKVDMTEYVYRMTDNIRGDIEREGEDEEELWGQTFLHLAVCFKKMATAVAIAKHAKVLISRDIGKWPDSKDAYMGLTPLHIAVAHGLYELVTEMVQESDESFLASDRDLEEMGERTKGTVFMGQLPLHIAVLSYIKDNNKEDTYRDKKNRFVKVIQILLKSNVSKLDERNGKGDTVLHSIMRFVKCFPGDEPRAVDMMNYLEDMIDNIESDQHLKHLEYKKDIFFAENYEHKTALQLATEYGLPELFKHFIKVEGVYHIVLPHDDIYEIRRFDVTEFDKVALVRANLVNNQENNPTAKEKDPQTSPANDRSIFKRQSIAELLCCQPLQIATKLVRADVFEEIIRRKRCLCLWYFSIFFVFHILFVSIFCIFAVARAKTGNNNPWSETFLNVCNGLSFICSFVYLFQECVLRFCLAKQPLVPTAVHHNGVYRVLMALFGVFLLIDGIVYRTNVMFPNDTVFLTSAIVVGTWSLMFFLRMCPYFSVYVVHINEGLFRAVLPFAILILLQVFAFSAAMHSAFLHPETDGTVVEQFETYGISLLTMGKLMIGLTEVEGLLDSRYDVTVIVLFILFVTVTFLLMINALIGVMTTRFGDTQTNKRMVWMIQRLSVIIFFEGWFMGSERLSVSRLVKMVGRNMNEDKPKDEDAGGATRRRYIMSYRKVSSKMADNPQNNDHALRRELRRDGELSEEIDQLLEVLESRHHDESRALQIYHYT